MSTWSSIDGDGNQPESDATSPNLALLTKQLKQMEQLVTKLRTDRAKTMAKLERQQRVLYMRANLLERTIIGDRNARDAIHYGEIRDRSARSIYNAACAAFFRDLKTANEDPTKKGQLTMLTENVNIDGSIYLEGLLDDVSYLIELEERGEEKEKVVRGQQKGTSLEKAKRLRSRILKERDSLCLLVIMHNKTIEKTASLMEKLSARLLKVMEQLAHLCTLQEKSLDSTYGLSSETSKSTSHAPDGSLGDVNFENTSEKIDRLQEEIRVLEVDVDSASASSTKAREEIDALKPIIATLTKGYEAMKVDSTLDDFILGDKHNLRYPSAHSREYFDSMRNFFSQPESIANRIAGLLEYSLRNHTI